MTVKNKWYRLASITLLGFVMGGAIYWGMCQLSIAEFSASTGLVCDIIGAVFLVHTLLLTPTEAIDLGVTYLVSEDENVNLKIPSVNDKIQQSKWTQIGLFVMVMGFSLQFFSQLPIVGVL